MQVRVLEVSNPTPIKEPPPLFPPRDEIEFRLQPLTQHDEELLLRHRSLWRIYTTSPYFYVETPRQKDVERYSDNYLAQDNQPTPESVLHLRSNWLPGELCGEHASKPRRVLAKRKRSPSPSSSPFSPLPRNTSLASLPDAPSTLASQADTKKPTERQQKRQKKETEGAEQSIELDYSDLAKHTVTQLRQFCRENKLAVVGRRKQEFIAAITSYLGRNKEKRDTKPSKQEPVDTGSSSQTAVPGLPAAIVERGEKIDLEQDQAERAIMGLDKMSRLEYQEQQAMEEGQELEDVGEGENIAREYEDMDEEENDYVEAHGFDDDEGEAEEDEEEGNEEDYL